MIWVIGVIASLLLILVWLLVSPVVIEIDTRIPQAGVKWISIGNARIWFENGWWLSFRVLFFRKKIRMDKIKSKPKKKIKASGKRKLKGKRNMSRMLKKIMRVIRTFRVTEWRLAVDSSDYMLNAQLYPLNFLPSTSDHLEINFRDENYLLLKIRNRPWKIVYAFFR